jgi:competence protein ComEA
MAFLMTWSSISTAATSLSDLGSVGDIKSPQQASEYIFRSSPKENLISVQLLGAVQKPGIYYVPSNTDLLKLLTLAGGSSNGGDFSEVMVRKTEPEQWAKVQSKALDEHRGTYEVDIKELIQQGGASSLRMNHDDLVYVPAKEPFVSSETSKTVTMVSVALSIVLTGLLIGKYSNEKN